MIRLLLFSAFVMLAVTVVDAQTPDSNAGVRVALYAAVGPVLTTYHVDVNQASLARQASVTLPQDVQEAWSGLRTLIGVERTRDLGHKQTQETAYYISSLASNAGFLGRMVRQHWHIENCLHYVLDVSLSEDACRLRKDNSALNLGTMRNIVMNLLRDKTRDKSSVPSKQKKAGWNNDYLLQLFA